MGPKQLRVVALAGGVGGAKLALGLLRALPVADLSVVGNTGDDETFFGLHVSPDLDTLMYTLAGLADPERGWGLAEESFRALDMLGHYGESTWFNLGDRDLATHIMRTQLLRDGWSLTRTTEHLARRLGVECTLAPMSDDPVRTVVETDEGVLPFQTYFVGRKCEPRTIAVRFEGADEARMSPVFAEALERAEAVIFCPSNPILSIGPILAVPGVAEAIRGFNGARVAVSPIVGSQALRGPAAKMMQELGEDVSPVGIAKRLAGLCDLLVIDNLDAELADDVRNTGMEAFVTNTVMETDGDKQRLAEEICDSIEQGSP